MYGRSVVRMTRPYVLLSCATSLDGYLDDASEARLVLSSAEDLDRVDAVRASCDAILVGAGTLRSDNPRLLVNSAARRAEREAAGRPAFPVKVTLTRRGDLDPALRFWHHGGAKLVYCPAPVASELRARLGDLAEVVGLGSGDLGELLDDLGGRGIRRLMVEGGGTIHTQFLAADLADELQVAIAPFLLGRDGAARFVGAQAFPQGPGRPMRLAGLQAIGDLAVLTYRVQA